MPCWFNIFAISRTRMELLEPSTPLANSTSGALALASASRARRFSRSSFKAVNAWIARSGSFKSCSVAYSPWRSMEGKTSDVTHRLNFFAVGSLLDRIRLIPLLLFCPWL